MTYELWNVKARSVIGGFESRADALACIREAIERHGRTYADLLLLGHEDDRGRSQLVAQGQELAELALADGGAPPSETLPISTAAS